MIDRSWMSPSDVQAIFRGQDLQERRAGHAHPLRLARWVELGSRPEARARRSR